MYNRTGFSNELICEILSGSFWEQFCRNMQLASREWPGNEADMQHEQFVVQELVSTKAYECTPWRWLRKELSVLPVNLVCLLHNNGLCVIFVASYLGSSPCRKTGEESGYEATNIIHSALQLWCVSASQ